MVALRPASCHTCKAFKSAGALKPSSPMSRAFMTACKMRLPMLGLPRRSPLAFLAANAARVRVLLVNTLNDAEQEDAGEKLPVAMK
jgi:hypothetical protein